MKKCGLCKVVGAFVKINIWDLMEDKCKKSDVFK
jgi:hypothetical protein